MSLNNMMLVYEANQKAIKEFNLIHNKFLADRGITNKEFEYRIDKMRSDRVKEVINQARYFESRF